MCWGKWGRRSSLVSFCKPRQVNVVECQGCFLKMSPQRQLCFSIEESSHFIPRQETVPAVGTDTWAPKVIRPPNSCHPALPGLLRGAWLCHLTLPIVWQMPKLLQGCISPVVPVTVSRLEKIHHRLRTRRTNGRLLYPSNTDPRKHKPEKPTRLS